MSTPELRDGEALQAEINSLYCWQILCHLLDLEQVSAHEAKECWEQAAIGFPGAVVGPLLGKTCLHDWISQEGSSDE